jgi:hypothetical protein
MMKLLTEDLRKQLLPLLSQADVEDPVVIIHVFHPWLGYDAWIIDGSPVDEDGRKTIITGKPEADFEFYALVQWHETGFGSIWLSWLESVSGPGGTPMERDWAFQPTPVSRLGLLSAGVDASEDVSR